MTQEFEGLRPKMSEFYGTKPEDDQYSPLIPLEFSMDEIIELTIQRGFHYRVRQVEGDEDRKILSVDPGLDYGSGRYGPFGFMVAREKVYVIEWMAVGITNLYNNSIHIDPQELTFLIMEDGSTNPKFGMRGVLYENN